MSQQPQSQPQYKPVYYLQRPHSPKNLIGHAHSTKNLSLTMSIGANQTANTFLPSHKTKPELPPPTDPSPPPPADRHDRLENELRAITRENAVLRDENEALRRELGKLRKEPGESVRSSEKYASMSPSSFNDLRGTIKKEMGEMKEMRLKLDMLSKQCKMYEEIIDKMDERIKKLTHENNKRNAQIDELQAELGKVDQLKDKANSLMRLYNDLESKFNSDQLDWMKWKQNWLTEKEYYLDRIREL